MRQRHLTVGKGERHADNIVFQQQRAEHLGTPLQRQRRPGVQRSHGPYGAFQHGAAVQANPCRLRDAGQRQHAVRPPGFGDFQRVSAGKACCAS